MRKAGKSQPPREKAGRKTNAPSRAVAARDPPVSRWEFLAAALDVVIRLCFLGSFIPLLRTPCSFLFSFWFLFGLLFRQKRVFGTSRCTNVPAKPATEKPAAKSATGVHRKLAQPAPKSPLAAGAALAAAAAEKTSLERTETKPTEKSVCFEEESPKNLGDAPAEKTSPEGADSKPKKKSVCFEEKSPKNLGDAPAEKTSPERSNPKPKKKSVCFEEKLPRNWGDESAAGPRTPVQAPLASVAKPRRSGTPYHTAENCSKCRFDRLETASYWLGQIKLAEPVGKHFVSANSFRMALECKAEVHTVYEEELYNLCMT